MDPLLTSLPSEVEAWLTVMADWPFYEFSPGRANNLLAQVLTRMVKQPNSIVNQVLNLWDDQLPIPGRITHELRLFGNPTVDPAVLVKIAQLNAKIHLADWFKILLLAVEENPLEVLAIAEGIINLFRAPEILQATREEILRDLTTLHEDQGELTDQMVQLPLVQFIKNGWTLTVKVEPEILRKPLEAASYLMTRPTTGVVPLTRPSAIVTMTNPRKTGLSLPNEDQQFQLTVQYAVSSMHQRRVILTMLGLIKNLKGLSTKLTTEEQFDLEWFREYGPVNTPYDGEAQQCCADGCRMMTCCAHEETDEDGFTEDPFSDQPYRLEWYRGVCDVCSTPIPTKKHAIRMPCLYGGWLGCYCSNECLTTTIKNNRDGPLISMAIQTAMEELKRWKLYE